MGSQQMMKKVD